MAKSFGNIDNVLQDMEKPDEALVHLPGISPRISGAIMDNLCGVCTALPGGGFQLKEDKAGLRFSGKCVCLCVCVCVCVRM